MDEPEHKLVLHIEVDDFYADDLPESAALWAETDEPTEADMLDVVLVEWLRAEVVLGLVSLPGDKCMNDDFQMLVRGGRIIGVSLNPPAPAIPVPERED